MALVSLAAWPAWVQIWATPAGVMGAVTRHTHEAITY
jgi:hypothetical protein